ncbi:hypothetical protein KFK09_013445 [Dendrobium nobile]|uniref:Uncharacterized protein n=1 Tax=Dendrobium nobile TaxID=94219 RepID=A0A8T3B7D4_DENNO|nr:hypothetical protein KFK09_013445 [Dendrobium nobile]
MSRLTTSETQTSHPVALAMVSPSATLAHSNSSALSLAHHLSNKRSKLRKCISTGHWGCTPHWCCLTGTLPVCHVWIQYMAFEQSERQNRKAMTVQKSKEAFKSLANIRSNKEITHPREKIFNDVKTHIRAIIIIPILAWRLPHNRKKDAIHEHLVDAADE